MKYYDNTRISAFKRCSRSFYFRHIRHWRREGIGIPLVFGLGWHSAMDVVWSLADSDKTDEEITNMALAAFVVVWQDEGLPFPIPPDDAIKYKARTPGTAHEMIWNYIQLRRDFIKNCTVLGVERPFAVIIDPNEPDMRLIGRLDKEFEFKGEVYVGEHKSTALYRKEGGFEQNWIESFSMSPQVDGYSHTIHMNHGNKAKAVWVDAALVHAKIHDKFLFIPIERQLQQMDAWLWETNKWIKEIEHEKEELEQYRHEVEDTGHTDFLKPFKRNTESCVGQYGSRCPYFNLCRFWNNPEEHGLPDGFLFEKWEPFDILKIAELGLPEENANDAWISLGRKRGFDGMTVKPDGSDKLSITAEEANDST